MALSGFRGGFKGGSKPGVRRGGAQAKEHEPVAKRARAERRHSSMRAIAVATSGVAPIEVIVSRMRHAWDEQNYELASKMAEIALPYTTPRLAAATITHRDALDDLSIDELRTLLAAAERAAGTFGGEGARETGAAPAGNAHLGVPTLQ